MLQVLIVPNRFIIAVRKSSDRFIFSLKLNIFHPISLDIFIKAVLQAL